MKNILMLIAVLLFSTASVFSHVSEFTVTWDNDECSCLDQGDSYYGVRYSIFDTQNNITVNAGTLVKVDFGNTSVDIEAPEVDTHCANQMDPVVLILCEVAIFCDSFTPPQGICSTGQPLVPPKNCSTFDGTIVPCGEFDEVP